jgi:hypothetical protein
VGSTSHLHTTILHTTRVLASTFNLYIIGHRKFYEAMLYLPIGEGRVIEADRDAQAIVYTKVEM